VATWQVGSAGATTTEGGFLGCCLERVLICRDALAHCVTYLRPRRAGLKSTVDRISGLRERKEARVRLAGVVHARDLDPPRAAHARATAARSPITALEMVRTS